MIAFDPVLRTQKIYLKYSTDNYIYKQHTRFMIQDLNARGAVMELYDCTNEDEKKRMPFSQYAYDIIAELETVNKLA